MERRTHSILIIEDNPADARFVQELLKETAFAEASLSIAPRLDDALRLVQEARFDAILLDLRLPDSEGMETFERMHGQVPEVPILLLTGLNDEELALRAVAQGAQDYMVKGQFTGDALARAIRYAMAREAQAEALREHGGRKRGRVIGFYGAKGGVGVSTLVLNLSGALARMKQSVIAAEMVDHCGTFAAQLGRGPVENTCHLLGHDTARVTEQEVRRCLVTMNYGPMVLFGPQQAVEHLDARADRLGDLVEVLASMADYTLLDLGSHPYDGLEAAAQRCDYVALVVQPGRVCLRLAATAVEMMRSWGPTEGRLGVLVVNRFGSSAPVKTEEYLAEVGCRVVGIVPPCVEGCLQAEQHSMLVIHTQPEGPFARYVADLALRLSLDPILPIQA